MVELMDTQDFLCILGLEQIILQLLFLGLFQQAVAEYGLPSRARSGGEVRMLMCLCTCFNTHSGVLGEAV